jgi:hypothetical protein
MKASPARQARQEFTPSYLDAVHDGLNKILGESGTASVLIHMKTVDAFPDPPELTKKLLAIFGVIGAQSLERAIVKELALRLKWSLDFMKMEGTFDFNATIGAIESSAKA